MSRKIEIFCTIDGCARSKKPAGRSKGRGFGAREDKMKEHVRTVHEKVGKKRDEMGDGTWGEDWEEEHGSEGDESEE
jgi:hypothetical protein